MPLRTILRPSSSQDNELEEDKELGEEDHWIHGSAYDEC
jgi:hypothetical protein